MSNHLPNYEMSGASPAIADDFIGIAMSVPPTVDLKQVPALPVWGVFQLSEEQIKSIGGDNPFRAVVLLLIDSNGSRAYSFGAAGSAIMLEPAKSPPGMVRGYFNVDAFRMARMRPKPGRFFLSAYLDSWRSPSIAVDVIGTLSEPEQP